MKRMLRPFRGPNRLVAEVSHLQRGPHSLASSERALTASYVPGHCPSATSFTTRSIPSFSLALRAVRNPRVRTLRGRSCAQSRGFSSKIGAPPRPGCELRSNGHAATYAFHCWRHQHEPFRSPSAASVSDPSKLQSNGSSCSGCRLEEWRGTKRHCGGEYRDEAGG